jgi:hypothetical protein
MPTPFKEEATRNHGFLLCVVQCGISSILLCVFSVGRLLQDFKGFEEPVEAIQENIFQLAKQIGLDKPHSEDFQELMDSQGEDLTTGEQTEIKAGDSC